MEIVHLVVLSFIVMPNLVLRESERAREQEREREREREAVSEQENSQKHVSNHHSKMSDRALLSDSKRITVLMIINGRNDDWIWVPLSYGLLTLRPLGEFSGEVKRGMPRKTPRKHGRNNDLMQLRNLLFRRGTWMPFKEFCTSRTTFAFPMCSTSSPFQICWRGRTGEFWSTFRPSGFLQSIFR